MTEQRYNVEKLKMAQQASLKILLEIDRICRAHDIKYMLDAGTLLGAVRHGGFIPWDDDVDIAMMREEFDKFRAFAQVELPPDMELVMHNTYGGGKAFYDFTPRIIFLNSRRRTSNKEMEYYDGKLNHLWVDIFIQDSIPDCKLCDTYTRTLQKVIYGMAMKHRFEIDFSKYSNSDRWKVKLLSSLGSLFDMKMLFSWQEKLSRKYNITQEKTDTYNIKEIKKELNKESVNNTKTKKLYYSNYQPDYIHDTVERSWSENVVDIEFEGHMLMAPGNPDGVLKVIYGDYMTLPPEEKRVPSHSDDVEVYE